MDHWRDAGRVALTLTLGLLLILPLGAQAAATTGGSHASAATAPPSAVATRTPSAPDALRGAAVGQSGGTATDQSGGTTTAPTVAVTARRTDGRGVVYDVTVTGLDDVGALWVLTDGTGRDLAGLSRAADAGRFRWDGEAATATVTLASAGDPAADGSLAVAGEGWAFAPVPRLVVAWRPTGGGEILRVRPFAERDAPDVDVAAGGEGVVGEDFALVGAATVHSRDLDGGRIRLVVPDGVEPRAGPSATLDALAAADATLDDGAGETDSVVFVLPPRVRDGGATYVSSRETWVDASARLDAANNVWLHEYVHTRQSFELGPRMAWFGEASAEYFGARLALETGLTSPVAYEAYLAGRRARAAPLTDRERWPAPDHPYNRGAVVLAALDGELRERTDGRRSLEDVFRRVNRHDGVVTYDVFVRIVGAVAGADMAPWLDRHVAGSAAVGTEGGAGPALGVLLPVEAARPVASVTLGVALLGGVLLRTNRSS